MPEHSGSGDGSLFQEADRRKREKLPGRQWLKRNEEPSPCSVWKEMGLRRRISPAVCFMICLSLLLAACLAFAGIAGRHEEERMVEEYLQTHSPFEDVLFCGSGFHRSKAANDSINTDAGQEICMIRKKEGKWEVYLPADLTKGAQVVFSCFKTLRLEAEEKGFFSLNSGDVISVSLPDQAGMDKESAEDGQASETGQARAVSETEQAGPDGESEQIEEQSGIVSVGGSFGGRKVVLENGSVWHASAVGNDGKTLGEGEIVFYAAQDVPTLYLNTESGSMEAVNSDKSVRENGSYLVFTDKGKKDAAGQCVVHGRGNSSWKNDKKQYSLNFTKAEKVLGIEPTRKFALVANHSDPSLLRNKVTFDIAGLCGMPATPRSVFVNVYFNGSYNGLYLLAQRPNAKGGSVRIAELEKENKKAETWMAVSKEDDDKQTSRVRSLTEAEQKVPQTKDTESENGASDNIVVVEEDGMEIHASPQESVPEDISGGYLLEMDGRYKDEDYWVSTRKHHFVVKYPEKIPLKEAEYIAGRLREAESSFYGDLLGQGGSEASSGTGVNTAGEEADTGQGESKSEKTEKDSGKTWKDFLDADSWAAMYILQDFMVQWDVESFSFFVYKDAGDPLLYCGPAWDFDLSMGITGLGKLSNVMQRSMWLRDHREGWLTHLAEQEDFSKNLKTFADERFFPLLEDYLKKEPEGTFQHQMEVLQSSASMDRRRWGVDDDYLQSAQALREWLLGRLDFLRDYSESPGEYCTVTFRYGFGDMDVYIRRGEKTGFVPTEEYGEHLYKSFRKKYGEINGWKDENGDSLTADTVIETDRVYTPY